MYIYQLPFELNKELCRLLDSDDDWKELAGVYMKYSPFDVNEMEQEAKRLSTSPCNQLFIRWGQLNHRVEELFILFHRMKHVPAMRCLVPVVDARFHKLLKRDSYACGKDTAAMSDNVNKERLEKPNGSGSSLPLPVMLIEKGVELTTSSKIVNRSPNSDVTSTESNSSNGVKSMNDELIRKVSAIPILSYEDLRMATNNWSEANLLGRGGFGHVYKGEWKLLPVAVKRLRSNDGINHELIREMCLNQYRHDNILPLYGYSLGGPEPCLVYQLMSGGSLEQRLRLKTAHAPLSWSQRHQIALGVARGLEYLHQMAGTPLIHGDIKPANILLDQCSMPKIGDFGLARRGPYSGDGKSHLKVSRVHGTRPYLPEEYLRSRCLSAAVDVFSFGVLMIEMATALHALDKAREQQLLSDYVHALADKGVDFAQYEDPILSGIGSRPAVCRALIALALQCTSPKRHERPAMIKVYNVIAAMDVS